MRVDRLGHRVGTGPSVSVAGYFVTNQKGHRKGVPFFGGFGTVAVWLCLYRGSAHNQSGAGNLLSTDTNSGGDQKAANQNLTSVRPSQEHICISVASFMLCRTTQFSKLQLKFVVTVISIWVWNGQERACIR